MVQTYSNNNKIYSVDMMFAYINIFKPVHTKILVSDLTRNLDHKCWGDPTNAIEYSPLDVLKDPELYVRDMDRIDNANLSYPIIVHNTIIVDGVHRLTKATLSGKKYIKAYKFDDDLMKLFLIDKKGDWDKVDIMQTYHYIELFYKRFSGK